jgi:hypothetical protein
MEGMAGAVHGGAEEPKARLRLATAPAQLRSDVRWQGVWDFERVRRSAMTRWWAVAGVRLSLSQVGVLQGELQEEAPHRRPWHLAKDASAC